MLKLMPVPVPKEEHELRYIYDHHRRNTPSGSPCQRCFVNLFQKDRQLFSYGKGERVSAYAFQAGQCAFHPLSAH